MEAAMKHIRMILINGPKRVGKTTNANLVADMIGRSLPDGCRPPDLTTEMHRRPAQTTFVIAPEFSKTDVL